MAAAKVKIAVLNEGKLNFDKQLSMAALTAFADVVNFDDTDPDQVNLDIAHHQQALACASAFLYCSSQANYSSCELS